jgi:hypothetical protein
MFYNIFLSDSSSHAVKNEKLTLTISVFNEGTNKTDHIGEATIAISSLGKFIE